MISDKELKELVFGLADSIREMGKRHDKEWAELRESQLLLKESQLKTDEQQKKTDEQLKKTDEQLKKTDEQLKKTDEQLQKTDKKLDRIAKLVGSISNNQGDVAEEYFANSLLKKLDDFLGMNFDLLQRNVLIEPKKGEAEEYDILLVNGSVAVVIEVKYKVHKNDIKKLERKVHKLKKLPLYNNYKIYGGIAGFHINEEAKKEALKNGYFILGREGDLMITTAKKLKVS